MAGSGILGRVRTARFPFAAPSWPTTVERPDPERKVGLDYDHDWSRRYPVRLARALVWTTSPGPRPGSWRRRPCGGWSTSSTSMGPSIFAANHASHIDTPLLLTTLPVEFRHRTVVAAASDYFFDRTWKSVLWSFALAAIPIERSKVNRRSADTAAELVEEGWNLVIFPEGGRSPDGWTAALPRWSRLPGPAYRAPRGARVPPRHPSRPAQNVSAGAEGPGGIRHRVAARRTPAALPHCRPVRGAHDSGRGRERPPLLRTGWRPPWRRWHARSHSDWWQARRSVSAVAPVEGAETAHRRSRGLGLAPGLGPRRPPVSPRRHGVARLTPLAGHHAGDAMLIERVGKFSLGLGREPGLGRPGATALLRRLRGADPPLAGRGRRLRSTPWRCPPCRPASWPTEDGRWSALSTTASTCPDADAGTTAAPVAYPPGLGGRANDACADFAGNLITGTLNMGPAEGSSWWFSASHGWRLLDPASPTPTGPTSTRRATPALSSATPRRTTTPTPTTPTVAPWASAACSGTSALSSRRGRRGRLRHRRWALVRVVRRRSAGSVHGGWVGAAPWRCPLEEPGRRRVRRHRPGPPVRRERADWGAAEGPPTASAPGRGRLGVAGRARAPVRRGLSGGGRDGRSTREHRLRARG